MVTQEVQEVQVADAPVQTRKRKNLYINITPDTNFDAVMKDRGEFSRSSWPIIGEMRRRSFYVSPGKKMREKKRRARRLAKGQTTSLHSLSIAILEQAKNNQRRLKEERKTTTAASPAKPAVPMVSQFKRTYEVIGPATQAVLIIVKFGRPGGPTLNAIVKDLNKPLLGFPFGGKETKDADMSVAARRETSEEIFHLLNVDVPLTEEKNFVGTIQVSRNHEVFVYCVYMPQDTPMNKGVEQEVVFRVPDDKVEEYIDQGILLETHTKGWELCKAWEAKSRR